MKQVSMQDIRSNKAGYQELRTKLDAIEQDSPSLESFTDFLTSLVTNIETIGNTLKYVILRSEDEVTKFDFSLTLKIRRSIPLINFPNYSHTSIPIPENFKGNLLTYTKKLQGNTIKFNLEYMSILEEFDMRAASIGSGIQPSIIKNDPVGALKKRVVKENKELAKYFKGSGSYQQLRDVYGSKKEMIQVFDLVSTNTTITDPEFITKVHNKLRSISAHIGLITDGAGDVLSKLEDYQIKELSDEAFMVAELADTIAVRNYDYLTVLSSVNKLREKIAKDF